MVKGNFVEKTDIKIIHTNNYKATMVVYITKVLLCLVIALGFMLEDVGLFQKFRR